MQNTWKNTTLLFLVGNVGAYPVLVKKPPPGKLVSFLPLFSIGTFLIIQGVFLGICYTYMKAQPW